MWHSPESTFTVSAQATILLNGFENYTFKITAICPDANDLLHYPQHNVAPTLSPPKSKKW